MICRICDGTQLEPVINLGQQPWCNHFLRPEEVGHEAYYPLNVVYCLNCCAAQLDYTVPKEVMFSDHTYLSGTTRTLREHFRQVAIEADRLFFQNISDKCALDIGSNDGTQLFEFRSLGYDVLGVESSKTTARIASEAGLPTVNAFFNLDFAKGLNRKFHLINASGVFFHLEELHSVAEGIRELLRKDGVFIVQFLYMKLIQENIA
ncbi:MAG: methyltransferase domain-containing protein, partial [bacterium]